jgi:HK97 gp10 family phage protein
MALNTRFEGDQEIIRKLLKLGVDYVKTADAQVMKVAQRVERTAKKSIVQNPRLGLVVTRYKKGRKPYQVRQSVKGGAPAGDSGQLASSIRTSRLGAGVIEVFVGADYASRLETDPKYDRPFLVPAFDKHKDEVIPLLIKELRRLLK